MEQMHLVTNNCFLKPRVGQSTAFADSLCPCLSSQTRACANECVRTAASWAEILHLVCLARIEESSSSIKFINTVLSATK